MKKGVTGEDMCAREEETEREATGIYTIQEYRRAREGASQKKRKDKTVKTSVFPFITDREFR